MHELENINNRFEMHKIPYPYIHERGHVDYTPRSLLAQEGPVCNVDDPDQMMHMISEEWRTRE